MENNNHNGVSNLEIGSGGGLRYNQGKLRYDLVHPVAHRDMVGVLTSGAMKYKPRNWEMGMKWSTVIASLKRHLAAIESGEDYDKETGYLHASHLACNAHFINAYYYIYPQGDDRLHTYIATPKIALDVDEVICDFISSWCEKFKMETPTSWLFDRRIIERFDEMKLSGELNEFYMNLKPKIKPSDIPFEPVCYITSRPVSAEITENWLDKHGFPSAPVHTVDVRSEKVKIAKENNVDIFVDDRFENFLNLNNNGICCYLLDAPHNQRYDVGYKRIKSLKELPWFKK